MTGMRIDAGQWAAWIEEDARARRTPGGYLDDFDRDLARRLDTWPSGSSLDVELAALPSGTPASTGEAATRLGPEDPGPGFATASVPSLSVELVASAADVPNRPRAATPPLEPASTSVPTLFIPRLVRPELSSERASERASLEVVEDVPPGSEAEAVELDDHELDESELEAAELDEADALEVDDEAETAAKGAALPPTAPASKRKRHWSDDVFKEHFSALMPPQAAAQAEREVEFLLESLQLPAGASILDVGCVQGSTPSRSRDGASRLSASTPPWNSCSWRRSTTTPPGGGRRSCTGTCGTSRSTARLMWCCVLGLRLAISKKI